MTVQLQQVAPTEIEAESFKIISAEFGPHDFDDQTFRVIQRVIHATGDFSFKDSMRFSPGAIARGIQAIRTGQDILTDVTMVARTGPNGHTVNFNPITIMTGSR